MISFSKTLDYKELIKQHIERTGIDLYKLVEKGEVIQLEDWHFITKEDFESAETSLAENKKVIDFEVLENTKYLKEHIVERCECMIKTIRNNFNEYYEYFKDNDPDYIDRTYFFLSLKSIFEYPITVIEAYAKYNEYENVHQRIYYQHKMISGFLSDKNQRIKLNEMDFQPFFNKRLFNKDEKLINLFVFIDTQLKNIIDINIQGLNITESIVFRDFLDFLLTFRDYYISAFKDVKLRNIEHFENILKSTTEKKEHGTPPPTFEPQQESKTEPEQQQNPYPRIFTSFQAFQLCQHLMKNNVTKNELADVSCFFHLMVKDEFIFNNIKRKEFLEYLQIEHDIPIEKLRPDGYSITDPKKQIYTTVKNQFQLH